MTPNRQDDDSATEQVTTLLARLHDSPDTLDKIMSMVYEDIHRIAHHQRHSLDAPAPQTTVLVHEAFIKLFGSGHPKLNDRRHLKRTAAKAVRHLIVDRARSDLAQKRGGGAWHTGLNEQVHQSNDGYVEYVLAIEQALERLEQLDPELAELVVGTYYGGYTSAEMAEITGKSQRTIERQLKRARGWLHLDLQHKTDWEGS